MSATLSAPALMCPTCRTLGKDVVLRRGGTPEAGWPHGHVPHEALRCPECDWQGLAFERLGATKPL